MAFFVYFSRQIGTFLSVLTLFASFDKQHRKNCEKLSANCFRLKRICDHEEVACKCQLLDLVMLPSHRLFKPEIGGSMAQKNAIFAHSPKESFYNISTKLKIQFFQQRKSTKVISLIFFWRDKKTFVSVLQITFVLFFDLLPRWCSKNPHLRFRMYGF